MILDLRMPGIDGVEVRRVKKTHPAFLRGDRFDQPKYRSHKKTCILFESVDIDELSKTIDAAKEKNRQGASGQASGHVSVIQISASKGCNQGMRKRFEGL